MNQSQPRDTSQGPPSLDVSGGQTLVPLKFMKKDDILIRLSKDQLKHNS